MAKNAVATDLSPLAAVQQATGKDDPFEACLEYLQRATTAADLFQAGQAIAPVVANLPADDQETLRERYTVLRSVLQHEVKAEELNGKRVTVTRARYTDTRVGPTYRLRGTFEDGGKERPFECWMPGSSRGPVYRFFERRAHDAYPVDVVFRLEAHPTDPSKTMWNVETLAPRRERAAAGTLPF
jgi:hypothetical protein